MIQMQFGKGKAQLDFGAGKILSLTYGEKELAEGYFPLFKIGMIDGGGGRREITSTDGTLDSLSVRGDDACRTCAAEAKYRFGNELSVTVRAESKDGALNWIPEFRIFTGENVEWIELPCCVLKPLKGEGGEASVLFPYNEGAIVDSMTLRNSTSFCPQHVDYPSKGSYPVFPNMICSQFIAYMMPDFGLYVGAHDPERGFKHIDFAEENGGLALHMRVYPADTGADIWKFYDGGWEDAAEIYRNWFEKNLPEGVKKISENERLPDWYSEMPLVVSYPVRGIHDMDEMKPNALFPYVNALGEIDRISETTGAKILALLMHWEGTAPWAPPYVWPPYGGEDKLFEFRDELHKRGDLLGVYCSGFGYTEKSNLTDYCMEREYRDQGLEASMCAGPDGTVLHSDICTGQRSGYDICPASAGGDNILSRAYSPLFSSGVDYAQILDQNHGGGQYLCYSSDHGHPPVPGRWMTKNMQKLLKRWSETAGKMLLGCESTAAEPFIASLPFSDNRFELNWHIGRPVPLCSYIYHEYMHNFMGNQVSSPFCQTENTIFLRMAYSFCAGDCLTIVLTPDGRVMDHWGGRDFEHLPDKDQVLRFAANLTRFAHGEAHRYLDRGRMIKSAPVECTSHEHTSGSRIISIPDVFTAAYTDGEEPVQILVNHTGSDVDCTVNGMTVTVPALNAVMLYC